MNKKSVKEKLAANEPVLCARLGYQDPGLVELVARLGIDCAWICTEHVGIDPFRLRAIIRAVNHGGAETLLRIRPSNYSDIVKVLEMGATGLLIPWVRTADEVREVVEMAKFYPQGSRGFDGSQVDADYGLKPMKDCLRDANDLTFIIIQIETPEAVENLEEIAAVEGVDALFLRPNDLSINYGIPGEFKNLIITKAVQKIVEQARLNGKVAATTCGDMEMFNYWYDMGFRFINYMSDYRIIRAGFEKVVEDVKELGYGRL
ncbi:MAG: HpcH/HpaI aldolase family protein [Chthoniobacterales bacterium]